MTLAVLMLATPAQAAPRPAPRDAQVWAAAQAARAAQLDLIKAAVNIDSGTGDVEGGRKVAGLLVPRLQALGMTVETIPAEAPGLADNVVATLQGAGKGRILLIGHLDTVFEPGTAARRPFRIDGDKAYGPGVSDEKGGVVQAIYALQILHDLKFRDFGTITFLMESSEERGSPGTRRLIDRLVRAHDVELNLEPGDAPDAITVWRKGSATYQIAVKGRAAHAGVAPQDGRNAAVELIHQLAAIEQFPRSGPGLTANLTILKAGSRDNIIPEDAMGRVNVRVRDKADFDRVEAALQAAAATTVVPDATVAVTRESAYPPLPDNPQTQALAARAQAIYARLGRTLATGGNGGASESALAAEAGTPALDGLGPVGGGFHAEREFLDLATVTPRLYLLTRMMMSLGADPPAR
ncbi:glutamate carboxypeptidase [Phenylobacterium sp.]|jgi:glutamate carboxypeptidase|uniref:glutamate carboxypeptidase n=1 Tax=Phenylobacterium sp. TaxID=1871053 RepID=UPI002F41BD2F